MLSSAALKTNVKFGIINYKTKKIMQTHQYVGTHISTQKSRSNRMECMCDYFLCCTLTCTCVCTCACVQRVKTLHLYMLATLFYYKGVCQVHI